MFSTKVRIAEQPFRGSLLVVPNDSRPHPGIVSLHGSEGGGLPAWKANAFRWAAEGYASLAFCYFGGADGFTGPRQTLADVEIQNLIGALKWLKESEFVENKKIALEGGSRGGELALLAGSLIDETINFPDAIAVHAPANKVWGAWNFDWVDSRCWLSDVPKISELHTPNENYSWNEKCGLDPRDLPPHLRFAWKWNGKVLPIDSRIEVEKIRCPVFLSQGMKDDVWPAEQAKEIEQTFKKYNTPYEAMFFESEGHRLSIEANFQRQNRLLNFYKRNLGD